MGIKSAEGREVQVGVALGEALGEPQGGLGPNLGILTPGLALHPGQDPQVALVVLSPPALAAGAAELTVTEDPGGTGTLEVVILAEWPLVAAFSVAHAVATLALATPGARLVLVLPQAGRYVTQ